MWHLLIIILNYVTLLLIVLRHVTYNAKLFTVLKNFFHDSWNVFDFVIVVGSLIDVIVTKFELQVFFILSNKRLPCSCLQLFIKMSNMYDRVSRNKTINNFNSLFCIICLCLCRSVYVAR